MSDDTGTGLEVDQLSLRYGGHVALNAVSLAAPIGHITGLIGPNGAGKTSLFNVCNGLLRPSGGTVQLFGTEVTRLRPAARARLGLGRTFQKMQLFTSMTVGENVAIGREARLAGSNPLWQQFGTRRQRQLVADAAAEAISICGIGDLVHLPVGTLSTGQRRLVELARVYAGGFRFLLLDEPSSGLDRSESERFGAILRELVEQQGVGILLVEHDMELVMEICDRLFVLDFGQLIFEGTPAETRASAAVRAAYLGEAKELESAGAAAGAEV